MVYWAGLTAAWVFDERYFFCYSDELLLEEDGSDVTSLSSGMSNGMRFSHAPVTATVTGGVGRLGRGYNQAQTSSSHGEWNPKVQQTPLSYNATVPHSPGAFCDIWQRL
ncbi:hypothetical protein ACLOJK_034134 [Asimina triloba]